MRLAAVFGGGLLLAAVSQAWAVDWKAFDDPKAIVLTDPVAVEVADLPADEKKAALDRLQASLASKEVEVRRRAALTLGKLGDKSGVPVMIADLTKAEGRDRNNVVVALRILKDDRSIPALRKALKDPSPYVRSIALGALGELKAAAAYDEIVALTKDHEGRIPKPGELNCVPQAPSDMACYALGALGDRRAVPLLIDLLADKDLQEQARQSLETLTGQKLGTDREKWRAWWKIQAK